MGRSCYQCDRYQSCSQFSSNQWRKGEGSSRCKGCVNGVTQSFTTYQYCCGVCNKSFQSQNNLDMHMQVHRPTNIACPVCGDRRFKSGANAVQHVESGYCSGCRGRENARRQIYDFTSSKAPMRKYMTDVPLLTNGSRSSIVPDYPYQCRECSRSFRQLSQLMQHQDQKHRHQLMLGN